MTYSTKAAAQKVGHAVVRAIRKRGKLRLDGVKLDVFENLGWHWALRHRHFGIYPARGGLYCLVSPDGNGSGRPQWSGQERSRYPDLLLRAQLQRVWCEITALQRCAGEVEALLVPSRKWQRVKGA